MEMTFPVMIVRLKQTVENRCCAYPKTQAPFMFVLESHLILDVNSRTIDDLIESSYSSHQCLHLMAFVCVRGEKSKINENKKAINTHKHVHNIKPISIHQKQGARSYMRCS